MFYVHLIKSETNDFLKDNAMHVKFDWWLYEGELECLEGEFEDWGEAAVPSLGGKTRGDLIEIVHIYFDTVFYTI